MTLPDAQVAALERCLSAEAGQSIRLTTLEELRPGRVARMRLEGAPAEYPATVIVKVIGTTSVLGEGVQQIATEVAAARFLDTTSPGLSPRTIVADPAAGALAIEDLGDGTSLSHVLVTGNARSAEAACRSVARVLGTLHRDTAGKQRRYAAVSNGLAPRDEHAERYYLRNRDVRDCWTELAEVANRFRMPVPSPAAASEFEGVSDTLGRPGAYLAFSNGDPCPDNWQISDAKTMLLDFEVAAFRHALLDAAYFVLPFPNCWCWSALPASVLDEMLGIYRTTIAATVASAGDDDDFRAEFTKCCAAWVVYYVGSRLARLLESNRVYDLFNERQRMIAMLDNFVKWDAPYNVVEALSGWARDLAGALGSLWPEEVGTVALYPAFNR